MTIERPRLAVLDYRTSNLHSALKALELVGADVHVATSPEEVGAVDGVVLPGVGHFGEVMRRMREQRLDEAVAAAVDADLPLLGICLGMQLLFDDSEEAPGVPGLGVLAGSSVALPPSRKLPNIGWREVEWRVPGLGPDEDDAPAFDRTYYFVHSFACVPSDRAIAAGFADHDGPFCAGVRSGNVSAVQFHPEKSSTAGLALLGRWVASVAAGVAEPVS